jgi:hypothetical protein
VQSDTKQAESMLTCSIKGLTTKGKRSPNGFVVFKGSQAVKDSRTVVESWGKKRELYIEEGLLSVESDCLMFTKNYEFTSPSAAAAIICGGSANGLTAWKNRNGVALKDLE